MSPPLGHVVRTRPLVSVVLTENFRPFLLKSCENGLYFQQDRPPKPCVNSSRDWVWVASSILRRPPRSILGSSPFLTSSPLLPSKQQANLAQVVTLYHNPSIHYCTPVLCFFFLGTDILLCAPKPHFKHPYFDKFGLAPPYFSKKQEPPLHPLASTRPTLQNFRRHAHSGRVGIPQEVSKLFDHLHFLLEPGAFLFGYIEPWVFRFSFPVLFLCCFDF